MQRLLALVFALSATVLIAATSRWTYPSAQRGDQVDEYHGAKVADPYRWLEDLDSSPTKAWVAAENRLTFGFLETLPQRAWFKDRLTKLWNYPKYGLPFKEGGQYFFPRTMACKTRPCSTYNPPWPPSRGC